VQISLLSFESKSMHTCIHMHKQTKTKNLPNKTAQINVKKRWKTQQYLYEHERTSTEHDPEELHRVQPKSHQKSAVKPFCKVNLIANRLFEEILRLPSFQISMHASSRLIITSTRSSGIYWSRNIVYRLVSLPALQHREPKQCLGFRGSDKHRVS